MLYSMRSLGCIIGVKFPGRSWILCSPTMIRDQLTDPKFYEEISKLMEDLIKQKRDDAESYEKFLKQAEELVKKMAGKTPSSGVPAVLHGDPEATVIFNNLPSILADPMSSVMQEGGDGFYRIVPDLKHRRASLAAKVKTKPVRHLRVV